MKHDLTTRTWQDDTGCPISIVLAATSDDIRHKPGKAQSQLKKLILL